MSGTTDKVLGDYAPSRAPIFPVGRIMLIDARKLGSTWIRNTETGEGGSFDTARLEEVLLKFFGENF